jgi:hypothetical protein
MSRFRLAVRFNRDQGNSMSTEDRLGSYKNAAGMLTVDEVRDKLGYPPLPNGAGKVLYAPFATRLTDPNYTPADEPKP